MRSVCFDIDGTLLNSQEMNRRAYAEVGVRVPEHAWGTRWQEWLTDLVGDHDQAVILHGRKTFIYADMVRDCDISRYELPAGQVAREVSHGVHGDVRVFLMTGGAERSTAWVIRRLDIHPAGVYTNLTHEARAARLQPFRPGTLYLDNLVTTVQRLQVEVPHIRSLEYVDQTYDQILTEVLYEPAEEVAL